MRDAGVREYRSTRVLWDKQSLESGVECGKEQRLGEASFASFALRGSFWCWRCFVFDPVWEIQLDTLSCMSTSIQSVRVN